MKRDTRRFERSIGADGKAQEILSAHDTDARDADARAFSALMRHLKQVDGEANTVLMVQVENEIGFLPFAREGGNGADLMADERASARAYAEYVEAVARAGKAEYPLPMYVNGAQNRPGVAPGDYPSGGPLAHLASEWQAGAPSIDFLSPDIYFPNFGEIVDRYAAVTGPLFIPEADRPANASLIADALRSIGERGAIGFSPFAIEGASPADAAQIASLYAMLEGLAPQILSAQAEGRMAGVADAVSFSGEVTTQPHELVLGPARITATTIDPWTAREAQDPSTHGALVIWLGGEDYLFAGQGVTFTFAPADGRGRLGLERVEEGAFVEGAWMPGRRLNGDQTHQGRHVRLPPGECTIQRVRLYRY